MTTCAKCEQRLAPAPVAVGEAYRFELTAHGKAEAFCARCCAEEVVRRQEER